MKITFPGVGSAFSKKNFNSMMVLEWDQIVFGKGEPNGDLQLQPTNVTPVTRRMLVDCGRTAPEALAGVGLSWGDIDAVYISHTHSDHCGGLEELAFMRKFVFRDKPKPILVAEAMTLDVLWENSLKGGLGFDQQQPDNPDFYDADHYFTTWGINYDDGYFEYAGQGFTMHMNQHIMRSFGLSFETGGKKVYISTDSLMRTAEFYDRFDLVFHDAETPAYKSGVHAHYSELRTLPAGVKAKMWLYHYQDVPLPDFKEDGFAGFVANGQVFNI